MENLKEEALLLFTCIVSLSVCLLGLLNSNNEFQVSFVKAYHVSSHHNLRVQRSKKPVLEMKMKATYDAKQTHFTKKCPKAPSSKFCKLNPHAKFKLNPDKFLIPVLAYGPMNQMNGLFETIALSIILNRTLILPKMYRHYQDFRVNGGKWSIDPAYRVSIAKLNELLSTQYSDRLWDLCPNGPDAIFPTHPFEELSQPLKNYVHNFEAHISEGRNWTLFKYEHGSYDVKETTAYANLSLNGKIYPPVDSDVVNLSDDAWLDTYGKSEEVCTVRAVPYHMYSTFQGDDVAFEHDGENYTTSEMHALIASYTKTPKYIHDLIAHFRESRGRVTHGVSKRSTELKTLDKLRVSVHWRFDHSDYQKLNTDDNLNQTSRQQILTAFDVYPGILSESVIKYVQNYAKTKNIFIKHLSVYIASPLEEQDRVFKAGEILLQKIGDADNIESASVLNSRELEEWRDWNKCDWVSDNWFEVCSQMEMRLVEDADIFLHAGKTSSWSLSVVERRVSDGIEVEWDAEVLEVIDGYFYGIVGGLDKEVQMEINKQNVP